jgi:hypothetical protein
MGDVKTVRKKLVENSEKKRKPVWSVDVRQVLW